MAIYRVVLRCKGVPDDEGDVAARDITQHFAEDRPHHSNVSCSFENGTLILVAENDFDPKGLALMDEFSDCISAFVSKGFGGDISVESATIL
jgi:hypothetical protein